MRIAILADRLVLGGLETHIVSCINEFLRRGHEIILCTEYCRPEIIQQINSRAGSFHHVYQVERWQSFLLSRKPDIIHAHPFQSIIRGYDLAKRLNRPFFITIHGLYDTALGSYRWGNDLVKKASAIIAVDERVASYLKNTVSYLDQVVINHNGLDLNTFYPFPVDRTKCLAYGLNPDWFTLVSISRLDEDKIPPVFQLFRCVQDLAGQLGGINVVIAGDGNAYARLAYDIPALTGGRDNIMVHLTGYQTDIRPYLALSDLVLACDRAAMEAMACQRPVLAANQEGWAGLITEDNFTDILWWRSSYQPLADDRLIACLSALAQNQPGLNQAAIQCTEIARRHFNIIDRVNELEVLYLQARTGNSVASPEVLPGGPRIRVQKKVVINLANRKPQ